MSTPAPLPDSWSGAGLILSGGFMYIRIRINRREGHTRELFWLLPQPTRGTGRTHADPSGRSAVMFFPFNSAVMFSPFTQNISFCVGSACSAWARRRRPKSSAFLPPPKSSHQHKPMFHIDPKIANFTEYSDRPLKRGCRRVAACRGHIRMAPYSHIRMAPYGRSVIASLTTGRIGPACRDPTGRFLP